MGHTPALAPMLTIEHLQDTQIPMRNWAAVVMTSGNAARALRGHPQRGELLDLPCFCVGDQTAQAARQAGFVRVMSARGDAGDLAGLLAAQSPKTADPLVYFAGNDRARDLSAELSPLGLQVETIVIYRAVAANKLPSSVLLRLRDGGIDAVLHYSGRTSAIFMQCCEAGGVLGPAVALQHVCVSERAAAPLRERGATRIQVASRPDEDAMLALVAAA